MCPSKSPVIQEVTTESRTTSIKGRVQQYQRDWAKMAPRRKNAAEHEEKAHLTFSKKHLDGPQDFWQKDLS